MRKVKPDRWASNWKVYSLVSQSHVYLDPFHGYTSRSQAAGHFQDIYWYKITLGVKPFNPTGGFDTGH